MATVSDIADSVANLKSRLSSTLVSRGWGEQVPLNNIQGYLPSYSIAHIGDYVDYTEARIRSLTSEDLKNTDVSQFVAKIPELCAAINIQQLANDPTTTINGLMTTLSMIHSRLPSVNVRPIKIDWESVKDKSTLPKDLLQRLRAVESRLTSLEPRAGEIDRKITDIEAAHEAAEQLPQDLAELSEKRSQVNGIVAESESLFEGAKKVSEKIEEVSSSAIAARERMAAAEEQAEKLIERSEQALRGSTGVGLAKAFENRQQKLSLAGTTWVAGLVVALLAALGIGAYRISALQSVLNNESPANIVWMNVILTVFGIGGPVWFAWLSTKQISVSFRLAEDYAFKAAISKAYEGYRSEAISIDPDLQKRLFASALDRFEESPIRLMEKETHSSPLQELLANPAIRKSLEGVPGIADKIIALIPEKGGVAAVVGSAAAVSAAVSTNAPVSARSRAKRPDEQ
ncbi:hypothetical protein [Agrobacterium larrymoorei]|uniref:Uncharacterized protein n=1 Tax=Agrobacterium larrymoorei TaxID=160699 RepID=A0AAF0H9Y9_9HYPH|nr:hypothetical protein [Agrobacterium larrymoorei]WHA40569.1 hypothetical protein CFBP5477_012165 [Agrobacterium larrymoorei]